MSSTSAADERRRWVARVARRFGCTMAEVRAMTLADVFAMDRAIRDEEVERRRAMEARKARGRR
jgi:hypothetical protein